MILNIEDLEVAYGKIPAINGVSLNVQSGEIVSLIGANGAGKSTLLKAVTGTHFARKGSIVFKDKQAIHKSPDQLVKMGMRIVVEGRGIFQNLTVEENLKIGGYSLKGNALIKKNMHALYDQFERLKERRLQIAGTLSGGEQQMLAIARALMSKPDLLLLDEPSLGLAPKLVRQVFEMIKAINAEGVSILLIEQNAHMALKIAHRGYVLEQGYVTLKGEAQALLAHEGVKKAYLGEQIKLEVTG